MFERVAETIVVRIGGGRRFRRCEERKILALKTIIEAVKVVIWICREDLEVAVGIRNFSIAAHDKCSQTRRGVGGNRHARLDQMQTVAETIKFVHERSNGQAWPSDLQRSVRGQSRR